jgi:TolB protein
MFHKFLRFPGLLLILLVIGNLLLSACGEDSTSITLTLPSAGPSENATGSAGPATTAPAATSAASPAATTTGEQAGSPATSTPVIFNTVPAPTPGQATTSAARVSPSPAISPGPQATATPRPALTAPQGFPGKLALLGLDNALYITHFDGSQPVVALGNALTPPSQTQDGAVIEWPTWSKDGSKLAAISLNIKSGQVDSADVIVTNGDGKNPVKVQESEPNPPVFISWSPDGNLLSVLIRAAGTNTSLELRLLDTGKNLAAAKASQRKVAEGTAVYSGWSPDSQQLLIHTSTTAADSALALLSVKDTQAKPTALKVTPSLFRSPAFSADGTRLAFAVPNSQTGKEDIYLQDNTGKDAGKLDAGGKGVSFNWSPADSRLAFSYMIDGSQGLYKGISLAEIDPKATTAQALKATQPVTDEIAAFFWSPDGKKIAYVTLNDSGDLLAWKVYDLASGKSSVLTEWYPSETWLQLINFFDQYAQTNSIWSPDSKSLVFAGLSKEDVSALKQSNSEDDVAPIVYILPVEGANAGKPQPVAYGNLAFWSK